MSSATIAAVIAATQATQAAPGRAATVTQLDDVVFTVEVNLQRGSVTVPFAPSSMTLQELVEDILVAE